MESDHAGTPLSERLELSGDQVKRIRTIVEAEEQDIQKAASFPIPVDPSKKPSTAADVLKLVESPAFRAAKEKAAVRTAARPAPRCSDASRRSSTEPQRQAYRGLLGRPFDLSRLRRAGPDQERQIEMNVTARALGLGGGGQRADPGFNTKVARPAYAGGPSHPRVLFDEAHHNFHTASGRYKPFAELITSDGYQVIPNKEKFSRDVLQKGDILVIANALGAENMGADEAANPAFTDAECDAVRDWVQARRLPLADHRPCPDGLRRPVPGEAVRSRDEHGSRLRPGQLRGRPVEPDLQPPEPPAGRPPDHPRPRRLRAAQQGADLHRHVAQGARRGASPILKLADTAIDRSFGDDGGEVSAAGRTQGLAFSFGKGRVVVMGEAAELSAQLAGLDRQDGHERPGHRQPPDGA